MWPRSTTEQHLRRTYGSLTVRGRRFYSNRSTQSTRISSSQLNCVSTNCTGDQPRPQQGWEQAVTSQGSWPLEVLFGFRGGAGRGGVPWELSCCCKTGTFQHESQTSSSLSFTVTPEAADAEKTPATRVTAARGQRWASFRRRGKQQADTSQSERVVSSQKTTSWLGSHMLNNEEKSFRTPPLLPF